MVLRVYGEANQRLELYYVINNPQYRKEIAETIAMYLGMIELLRNEDTIEWSTHNALVQFVFDASQLLDTIEHMCSEEWTEQDWTDFDNSHCEITKYELANDGRVRVTYSFVPTYSDKSVPTSAISFNEFDIQIDKKLSEYFHYSDIATNNLERVTANMLYTFESMDEYNIDIKGSYNCDRTWTLSLGSIEVTDASLDNALTKVMSALSYDQFIQVVRNVLPASMLRDITYYRSDELGRMFDYIYDMEDSDNLQYAFKTGDVVGGLCASGRWAVFVNKVGTRKTTLKECLDKWRSRGKL